MRAQPKNLRHVPLPVRKYYEINVIQVAAGGYTDKSHVIMQRYRPLGGSLHIIGGSILAVNLTVLAIAASVSSLTPNQAPVNSAPTPLAIAGSDFITGSILTWTAPNGAVVSVSPTFVQAAQIAATIPANLLTSAGTAQVAITAPGGAVSNSLPFTIGTPPAISSLNPDNALVGSAATLLALSART